MVTFAYDAHSIGQRNSGVLRMHYGYGERETRYVVGVHEGNEGRGMKRMIEEHERVRSG